MSQPAFTTMDSDPHGNHLRVGRHGRYSLAPVVFAHGGRAVLYEIVDSPVPLLYKSFKEPLCDGGAANRLGRLVAEGRTQFVTSRKRLGSCPSAALNWPVDLVVEQERVVGVVLPRVPQIYNRANGTLRNMEFFLLRRGEAPTAAQRVTILIRLAELLDWLARRKLVHGDVSPRNVLWTATPSPEVLLLDVDGIHDDVTEASEYVATPAWTDPRVLDRLTDRHDAQSDWYALALFMYRGLLITPGMLRKGPNGWPGPTLPPSFFPGVRALLTRALENPLTNHRPRPDEWVTALLAEFFPGGSPNWAAFDLLDRYAAVRYTRDRSATGNAPPGVPPVAAPSPRPRWRWR